MLKNSILPTKYDSLSSYTCGEIVCQSEISFTIVCKFCDIKIFNFDEFIQHFRNTHWTEIKLSNGDFKIEQQEAQTATQKQSAVKHFIKEENEQVLYEEYNLSEASNDIKSDEEDWTPPKDDDSTDSETIAIIKKV